MATCPTRLPRAGLVLFLVAVLVSTLGLPAMAASVEERRLRQTQSELSALRERISGVAAERQDQAAAVAEAERRVAQVLEAVNQAELAVQRQRQAVDAAQDRLSRLEDEAQAHRRVMTKRAVTLYRQGTTASWAALFAAGDAEEVLERSNYVQIVSRADRETFERGHIDQVQLAAQRATLEAEEAALQRVVVQQQEIHAEVESLRQEEALQLAGVDERLASLRAQEAHLESESRELAAMARRATQARQAAARSREQVQAQAPAPAQAVSSGGWTWPARGPVTSGYGMRWGRRHEGIDIGARSGAAVVAARAGQVSFVGRMGGYGNLVLVNHGGGIVTAYAHLSSFSVSSGQQVSGGQRIGSVGCTGSCTGPHLHFEVRVNGAPRNPRSFLP